jgi:CheY-like chemotaxis protein
MIDKTAVHILVVDDEPFMLNLNRRALTNLGYTAVTTCDSAGRALEAIDSATEPVDLILLDLNMPDMDGVEMVRHLVERGFSGSLILVSGEDERILQAADKLIQAHRITTLGHLRKPVKPRLLTELLEKWRPAVWSEYGTPQGATGTKAARRKGYSADEVRSAIVNGELINYYQPKVSLKTGHLTGVETLVRWRHPLDGLVFPDQFIGVAEAHGLISDLTRNTIGC